MSGTDKTGALAVLDEAWRDFEGQRLAMASTLNDPLKEIPLEVVTPRIQTDGTPLRHAKRLTAPVERLGRPVRAAAAKAKTGLPKRSQANKRKPVLPRPKTTAKPAPRKVKRLPAQDRAHGLSGP
jgi:hypothetical protein